jgi:hypothetical protein
LIGSFALFFQSPIEGVGYQDEIVRLIQTHIALAHFIPSLHADEIANTVFRRDQVTEWIIVPSKIQILDIGVAMELKPFGYQIFSKAA